MPTDFDPARPEGRRLRVSLFLYHNAPKRQFRYVPGVGAALTVRDEAEQASLWQAIESAIAAWRETHAAPIGESRTETMEAEHVQAE